MMNAPDAATDVASEVQEEGIVIPTKTFGERFKEVHGYSYTMHKNMKKNNCTTPEEYRLIRKAKKKQPKVSKPKGEKPTKKK